MKPKKEIRVKRSARWFYPSGDAEKTAAEIHRTLKDLVRDAKKAFPSGYQLVDLVAGMRCGPSGPPFGKSAPTIAIGIIVREVNSRRKRKITSDKCK